MTITFAEPAGIAGVIYGAQCTNSLSPENWTAVPDSGSGTTHIFSVPLNGNTSMFMQLTVTEQ
jgi:hypothetical protein